MGPGKYAYAYINLPLSYEYHGTHCYHVDGILVYHWFTKQSALFCLDTKAMRSSARKAQAKHSKECDHSFHNLYQF